MKKQTRARIIILSITLILTATLLSVALFSGRVEADITQEGEQYYLKVKSTYLTNSIENIYNLDGFKVSLYSAADNFERGENQGGISSLAIKSGDYSGGSLDKNYRLHSYSKVKCVIILEKNSAESPSILVFNLKSEKKTKEFYDKLKEVLV